MRAFVGCTVSGIWSRFVIFYMLSVWLPSLFSSLIDPTLICSPTSRSTISLRFPKVMSSCSRSRAFVSMMPKCEMAYWRTFFWTPLGIGIQLVQELVFPLSLAMAQVTGSEKVGVGSP